MKVSEQAAKELKKALIGFEKPAAGIHIFNTQGCCGPSIQMDIAMQAGKNEIAVNIENIDFFVDNDLWPTLENVTIEYGPNGFKLNGLNRGGGGCCG